MTCGHVYTSAVHSVLLYASETWPMTTEDLNRVVSNDNSMIRSIYCKDIRYRCSMTDLQSKLKVSNIMDVIMQRRLRWYGHVMRMDVNFWQHKIMNFNVEGATPRGRPKLHWSDNIKQNLKTLKINHSLAADRAAWRQKIKM